MFKAMCVPGLGQLRHYLLQIASFILDVFGGSFAFSDSSPLNSANATLSAILALCLVGVGASTFGFGVLGLGVAFGFTSGLVSGL